MALGNKQIVRQFYEAVFNEHEPERAREFLDPQIVVEDVGSPETIRGIDTNIGVLKMYLTAFPDMQTKIVRQVEEGDWVATQIEYSATHKGPLFGNPPTNRRVRIEGIELDQVKNGKIVWGKVIWDVAGLARQLGLNLSQAPTEARPRPQART